MLCPFCRAANDDRAEACFICGKALFILTQGTLLAERYEILGPVGQGGMSRVYKATDRVLSETVAIKVLRSELSWDPVLAARFLSEIKLARKVSHRSVCRIHEYGEDRGVRFICMELIDGTNLKDRLREGGLPPAEAFEVVTQVAEGLQAVHAGEIIHRDLKTSNIMIDARGVVKLMDFGIAKQAAKDTDWSLGSGGGHVVGTPEYMSPEQARGGKLDFRSDIYSLGCVVFEIFTGRAPFKGQTPIETLFKHVNEEAPLTDPDLPSALVPVLRKMLAKKPDDRFADLEAFLEALRLAQSGLDADGSATRPFPAAGGALAAPTALPAAASSPSVNTFTLARESPRPAGEPAKGAARLSARLFWAAGLVVTFAAAFAIAFALRGAGSLPDSVPRPVGSPVASPSLAPRAVPATQAAEPRESSAASPGVDERPVPFRIAGTEMVGSAPPAPAEETPTMRSLDLPASAPPGDPASPVPTPSAAPAARGTLMLLVVPASEVTVDGVSLGTFSLREIPLEAGAHTLRILHPQYEPLQRKVQIRAGESQRLVLDLAEKGIPQHP